MFPKRESPLITVHGSILCVDRAQGRMRHLPGRAIDQSGQSVARVSLERGADGARFLCSTGEGDVWLRVSPDAEATVVSQREEATVFAAEVHPLDRGRPGLAFRLGTSFLTANRGGYCTIGATVARAWELFAPSMGALDAPFRLPDIVEFRGEFGAELVLFLPFCEWASRAGFLKDRELRVHAGMRCFYDHMAVGSLTEKTEGRKAVPRRDRPYYLPVRDEHWFGPEHLAPTMVYPNLRAKFARMPLEAGQILTGRKLLVVHNKSTTEWGIGPVNRIPLSALEAIFSTLSAEFDIVYIRHGMRRSVEGYSDDVASLDFADAELLERFPGVIVFDDLYAAHQAGGGTFDVNTFKNVLYSRCFHFVTSQGGGAHHIAMFEGSVMAILHVRGQERYRAYRDGYYSFMARIPPLVLLADDGGQLVEVAGALRGSAVMGGKVNIASEHLGTAERFLPR